MSSLLTDLYTLVGIAAIGVGIFLVEELGSLVIRRVARRAGAAPTVLGNLKTTLRLVALVLVVSNVLNFAGLSSLSTTLTVSGIIAIATSLALQTTLSNVISGLLLFNDGLVRLNDQIEYGGTKGTIVRIGLRNTWIRTDAGSLSVVSNSSLSGGPLLNHTATERLSKRFDFDGQ